MARRIRWRSACGAIGKCGRDAMRRHWISPGLYVFTSGLPGVRARTTGSSLRLVKQVSRGGVEPRSATYARITMTGVFGFWKLTARFTSVRARGYQKIDA